MNRSLMIMFMMGIIAMVLMTAFGSFFVGKVGGAENVATLRTDLVGIFGTQMADPEALTVSIRKENDVFGVVLRYEIEAELGKRERAFAYHLRRVSEFVLSREAMRKHTNFVEIHITMPDGKIRSERYVRKTATDR